ncbi:MAG: PQQ-binding-like beta-propeller repeat protein [Pseudomonadales bacterium]
MIRVAYAMVYCAIIALVGCGDSGTTVVEEPQTATDQTADAAPNSNSIQAINDALAAREALPGRTVYDNHCAACHNGAVQKAPHRLMIGLMTPEAIDTTLTTGLMAEQGSFLTKVERVEVAEYLAGVPMGSEPPAMFTCSDDSEVFDVDRPPRVSGWGLQPTNTRMLPESVSGISKSDLSRLTLKWAFAFPGANRARSQPALAGGAIYVGGHNGLVYALDQETGCVRWTYESAAEVRTGIIVESWQAGDADAQPMAFFGDVLGNVYAINARTGAGIWRIRADEHPNATITGSPSLYDGRLYVPVSSLEVSLAADPIYECCTGRGAVLALNAASGEVLWKTYTVEETPVVQSQNRSETNMIGPSGAMVWNSPTIDAKRNQLYIGTGENMSSPATLTSDAIFAMDLDSGKVNWVFQATANDAWNVACGTRRPDSCPEEDGPDFDFGAGTLMLTAPTVGDLVIGGQKSGKVHALNPDTGELVWQTRVGRGGIQGGVHFGMAADSDQLYVPISDMADGRTYPDPDRPGIHALDPDTGEELWWSVSPDVCDGRYFCHPGVSQAITTTSGMVFAGGMDGVLRIHDSTSGEVLWEMDSTQTIPTVSGAEAFGGSFGGGSAPILQDGVMVLSSGYGIYLHMPGNLLMVFEVGEES